MAFVNISCLYIYIHKNIVVSAKHTNTQTHTQKHTALGLMHVREFPYPSSFSSSTHGKMTQVSVCSNDEERATHSVLGPYLSHSPSARVLYVTFTVDKKITPFEPMLSVTLTEAEGARQELTSLSFFPSRALVGWLVPRGLSFMGISDSTTLRRLYSTNVVYVVIIFSIYLHIHFNWYLCLDTFTCVRMYMCTWACAYVFVCEKIYVFLVNNILFLTGLTLHISSYVQ